MNEKFEQNRIKKKGRDEKGETNLARGVWGASHGFREEEEEEEEKRFWPKRERERIGDWLRFTNAFTPFRRYYPFLNFP